MGHGPQIIEGFLVYIDRGVSDYTWLKDLTMQLIHSVTRLKVILPSFRLVAHTEIVDMKTGVDYCFVSNAHNLNVKEIPDMDNDSFNEKLGSFMRKFSCFCSFIFSGKKFDSLFLENNQCNLLVSANCIFKKL